MERSKVLHPTAPSDQKGGASGVARRKLFFESFF